LVFFHRQLAALNARGFEGHAAFQRGPEKWEF
jgi:hypothetical protein